MESAIRNFTKELFNLRKGGEHAEQTIENIRNNVEFRGASLWILIFAVVIASIGLNINSIPVILGAMLISPLMGPIVGFALSLGIHDTALLKRSLKSLAIAIAIGVVISTLYFLISPISYVQSELLARTSPTIYDVLIAFFGGLAGIVGSTRASKGNVIPGVALATALMPPLCTVGYGIATLQPKFFFGALYLLVINCIFICLATLIGVKYLRLPKVSYVSAEEANRIRKMITVVVVAMIIPSVYLGYFFVKENNFRQNAERYLLESFTQKGHVIIYKDISYHRASSKIKLAFLAEHFTPNEITTFESLLPFYDLAGTTLLIRQDNANLSEEEWNTVITNIRNEGERVRAIEAKLTSGFISPDATPQILKEAQAINEKVGKIALGALSYSGDNQSPTSSSTSFAGNLNAQTILIYGRSGMEEFTDAEKAVLASWIRSRLQNSSLVVLFPTPVLVSDNPKGVDADVEM